MESNQVFGYVIGLSLIIGTSQFFLAKECLASGIDPDVPQYVSIGEYAVYDRVFEVKFFTSRTELVVIQRLTASRLDNETKPVPLRRYFEENQFFHNTLPKSLIQDFLLKSVRPARLESKFSFDIPVKFVTGDWNEDAEVFLAPLPVRGSSIQKREGPLSVLGVFQLSRVSFTPRQDQALVYVGIHRPDQTGAGFLFWLYRAATSWEIYGTEVLWTLQ